MNDNVRYPLYTPVVEFMLELVDVSRGEVTGNADEQPKPADPPAGEQSAGEPTAYREVASHLDALTEALYGRGSTLDLPGSPDH